MKDNFNGFYNCPSGGYLGAKGLQPIVYLNAPNILQYDEIETKFSNTTMVHRSNG